MEKRLSLTIDSSKAKQGAKEIEQALGKLEGKAKTILKAFEKVGDFDKLSQRVNNLKDKVDQVAGSTDQYAKTLLGAEKAIEANYAKIKLLNTETGKELELSKKMVANKKLELEVTSEEAQVIAAANIATKQTVKAKEDLVKAQERLNYVQTDEYKQLVKLNSEIKKHEKSVQDSLKPIEETKKEVTELDKVKRRLAKTQEMLALTSTKEWQELQRTKQELNLAEKAARGLDDQSRKLQRTMMGVGIAASMFSGTMIIEDLIRTADAYTELQNKLAVVRGSTEGLTRATDELLRVAIDSRSSMEATVDLYSKLIRVNKEYGYTQKEILTITETVSKAVAMSGASAQAAEGAVIQFAQALAGDFKTAGQELNSVIEQTPGLAEALAQGLTKVGNIGEVTASRLKKLASEGLIDTRDVMEGFIAVYPEVAKAFDLSTGTISQSLKLLNEAFTNSFGKFDKTNELSKTLTSSIDSLTESFAESQKTLGALVGLMTGGAILAIGGTATALGFLIGAVPLGIGAVFLGLAAGIGAIAAESAEAQSKLESLTSDLEDLDKVLTKFETKEQARDRLEDTLSQLNDIDTTIEKLEGKYDSLTAKSNASDHGAPITFGKTKELKELEKQIEKLYENRGQLQDLSDEILALLRGEDLPDNKKAENDLKRLNNQLDDFIAKGQTKEQKAWSELQELLGLLAQAKDAGVDEGKIVEANEIAWRKYQEAIAKVNKSKKELNTDFDKLISSMKDQLAIIGMTTHEANLYNIELKAREAAEKQYGKNLDENNARVQQAINLQKQLNAAMATEEYNQAVKEAGRPKGLLGELEKVTERIERTEAAGGTTTASGNGLLYYQTFEGVSSGIADAITSGDTANLAQSFGSLLGSGVSDAVGKGIASSIGGMAGGLLGGIGGGVAGGLVARLFEGRTTSQTGSGYNINLAGGNIASAFSTQSFRRSGNLLRGSESWTEQTALSLGVLEGLGNSIAQASATTSRQAELLGISLDEYTGTLENKNGSLSDALSELSNKTADQAFAAIEKFQYVGESFAETFSRLAEIAGVIESGFRTTGLSVDTVRSQFVSNREQELTDYYQAQIVSTRESLDQAAESARMSVSRYYYRGGKNDGYYEKYWKVYEKDVQEAVQNATAGYYQQLDELYSRLNNVSVEAAQDFNQRLLAKISDLQDVSVNEASGVFTSLTEAFLQNYYSAEERLRIAADNAAMNLAQMDINGIDLNTTSAELRHLYETASSPERLAEILSAANALADYNKAMEELTGSTGVFVGSLSDALTEAFDKLVTEINGVADSVDNATRLMQRQRAEQTLQNALAEAQSTGSVQDSEQLRNALNIISKPSEELYSDYASYMRSLGTSANIIDELRQYGSIPQFADGGYHSGGLRLVGEVGAEIEATGASRIMSNQDMTNALDMRPIANELNAMRRELQATQMQLVRNSAKLNSDIARMREDVSRIRQEQESTLYQ